MIRVVPFHRFQRSLWLVPWEKPGERVGGFCPGGRGRPGCWVRSGKPADPGRVRSGRPGPVGSFGENRYAGTGFVRGPGWRVPRVRLADPVRRPPDAAHGVGKPQPVAPCAGFHGWCDHSPGRWVRSGRSGRPALGSFLGAIIRGAGASVRAVGQTGAGGTSCQRAEKRRGPLSSSGGRPGIPGIRATSSYGLVSESHYSSAPGRCKMEVPTEGRRRGVSPVVSPEPLRSFKTRPFMPRLDKLVAERFSLSRRRRQEAVRNGRVDSRAKPSATSPAARSSPTGRSSSSRTGPRRGTSPAGSGSSTRTARPGRRQARRPVDLADSRGATRHACRSRGPVPDDPPRPGGRSSASSTGSTGHIRDTCPGPLRPRPSAPSRTCSRPTTSSGSTSPSSRAGRAERGDHRPRPVADRGDLRRGVARAPAKGKRPVTHYRVVERFGTGRHAGRLLARDGPDTPDPDPPGRTGSPGRWRPGLPAPHRPRPRPASTARRSTPRPSASSTPSRSRKSASRAKVPPTSTPSSSTSAPATGIPAAGLIRPTGLIIQVPALPSS